MRPPSSSRPFHDRGINHLPMSTPAVKSMAPKQRRLHPLPLRIMHWINAVAIFIMIGSGWKIYNDDVIFGWLHFPDFLVIGKWAQYGLQWHFFGMWIFIINGIVYLTYGIVTGRFRQKLFPITLRDIVATVERCAALSPDPRRSDGLQRGAENSLSRRHLGRRFSSSSPDCACGSRCSFPNWRACSAASRSSA